MISFLLFGACGRMGRTVLSDFTGDKKQSVRVIAGVERPDHPHVGTSIDGVPIYDNVHDAPDAEVWLDFSLAEAAVQHAELSAEKKIPLVIAATGFSKDQLDILRSLSKTIPILYASNLSVGIGVTDHLIDLAAQVLGSDFDIVISESHHNTKIDRPSGTALKLKETIINSVGIDPEINSIRAGGLVGEHEIRFVGEFEEVSISHRAFTRRAFSSGVERALKFALKASPGFYSFRDMYK